MQACLDPGAYRLEILSQLGLSLFSTDQSPVHAFRVKKKKKKTSLQEIFGRHRIV